jgi:hypothetical protein
MEGWKVTINMDFNMNFEKTLFIYVTMEGWKVTINMDFNMNIEKYDFNIFKVSSTSHQELYFTPPPFCLSIFAYSSL